MTDKERCDLTRSVQRAVCRRLVDKSVYCDELHDRVVTLGQIYNTGDDVLRESPLVTREDRDEVMAALRELEVELIKCAVPVGPNKLSVVTLDDVLAVNSELKTKYAKEAVSDV